MQALLCLFAIFAAASCGRLPSRAEPPNCEPGSFINSSKKVGKEKCSECPPGTYSDSVGARECKKCDLNFALAVETGMTECDLCDAGSRPVDGIFCSRKAKLTCPEKGPGSEICRQTTDSNPETFATIPAGVSVRYFLGKPEHFGSITFIRKKDCCSKDVEDIKITFPNEGYCITDAESTENSTENYLRLSYPYCGYEEMKYFDVSSWRTNRSITFRDIEFEALKLSTSDLYRAQPPNCPPGDFINSTKGVGKEKCSECPPGTYSDSVGAKDCKKCDLNFALALQTGMTQCDLCETGSRAVNGLFCARKAKLTCPEKGPGSDICRQTTDSNPETFATIPAGVSVRYFLEKPENFGSLTFIRKKDCCSKDVEDIRITFPNNDYCITDSDSTENSTENYLRLSYPYCSYEYVKYFDVSSWRTNRSITFRDIEFEAWLPKIIT